MIVIYLLAGKGGGGGGFGVPGPDHDDPLHDPVALAEVAGAALILSAFHPAQFVYAGSLSGFLNLSDGIWPLLVWLTPAADRARVERTRDPSPIGEGGEH